MSADKTTSFRLDQMESRQKVLGDRIHDIATVAHECRLRLDEDVQRGADREARLRKVEVFIEQQQGMSILAKAIMAFLGLCGGALGEFIVRHF